MFKTSIVWLAVYPIVVFTFFLTSIWQVCSFLFNSPVDVWMMLSSDVDESIKE